MRPGWGNRVADALCLIGAIATLLVYLHGCGMEPNPFAQRCFHRDGVTHLSTDCDRALHPRDAAEDMTTLMQILDVTTPRALGVVGCRMQYSAYETIPIGTDPDGATCAMNVDFCFGRIGDHDYESKRSHFRHELFHRSLWALEGDADSDHSDPRWEEGIY